MGIAPAKCRLTPTVKQTSQHVGVNCTKFSNFDRLWSRPKICKRCLQTASALPDSLPELRLWTSPRDFQPPDPLGSNPHKWIFLASSLSLGQSQEAPINSRTKGLSGKQPRLLARLESEVYNNHNQSSKTHFIWRHKWQVSAVTTGALVISCVFHVQRMSQITKSGKAGLAKAPATVFIMTRQLYVYSATVLRSIHHRITHMLSERH